MNVYAIKQLRVYVRNNSVLLTVSRFVIKTTKLCHKSDSSKIDVKIERKNKTKHSYIFF